MRNLNMNTYDELPYPSLVYADTHPQRLATLAKLFGLQPPPVTTSRVLELGCADGSNLLAIAQSLPHADCWGIDAAGVQIAKGQQVIAALHLPNVSLKQLNFTAIDDSLGRFDYIIAHGVYSWVPTALQETVLNLCQRHLTANGIAYLSYNVYPGWHLENVARDLMMYHTQQLPPVPLPVSLSQARGILQFITQLRSQGQGAFDVLLQEQWQQIQTLPDNYLCHDLLETDNHPVYFKDFIQQAAKQGLAYVTDIEFRHYLMLSFSPPVVEALEELFQGDYFRREQYLDFFYNRTLRRSLLCHHDQPVQREIAWEVILDCYLGTTLQAAKPPINYQSPHPEIFQNVAGESISITHPLTKLAILHLTKIYPYQMTFEDVFNDVCQRLRSSNAIASDASDEVLNPIPTWREILAQELLSLYLQDGLELNIYPPTFVTTLTTSPTASPLARWQASQGQAPLINLRSELINLSPLGRAILPHLNGQQNRPALLHLMTKILKQLKIKLPTAPSGGIQGILEETLLEIARSALLVA